MKDTIKFLPLLLIYILIVLIANTDNFWGDEGRYVMYANNLLNGYYSPEDRINLWNGPGYPIVLMPFAKLELPWLAAKLLNPLFLFIAILYFYHTLLLYIKERSALIFSYLLGIYPPFYRYIHLLITEQLAILLVCGFMFHLCKLIQENKYSWTQLLISSVFLGYLALTKILFGYVILIGLLFFLSLYIWKKKNVFKKTFLVYLFAILCCVPYLFYTYSLTGKFFYWGNSGGIALYAMSTPYEDELGGLRISDIIESENHKRFFEEIKVSDIKHIGIQEDEVLKKQALHNILNNPAKYLKNWTANIGRLLFNYPYDHDYQKLSTYFYIVPNMFLIVSCILCFYPSYLGSRLIPAELYILGLLVLIGTLNPLAYQ